MFQAAVPMAKNTDFKLELKLLHVLSASKIINE